MKQNDVIVLTSNYWDRESKILICKDSVYYDSLYSIFLNQIIHEPERLLVSDQAFKYLENFINKNCISKTAPNISDQTPLYVLFSLDFYHVESIEGNSRNRKKLNYQCFYYYPKEVIAYFQNMKKYLEESKYKKEYQMLINHLEIIIGYESKVVEE